jgi:hypothetical protein
VAQEHKLLAFIVLALVLNEMVLALEKKRWTTGASRRGYRDWGIETGVSRLGYRDWGIETGVSSTRTLTALLSTSNQSNDRRNYPKNRCMEAIQSS